MTAKETQALQAAATKAFKDPKTRLSKNLTIHRQRFINQTKKKKKE